VKPRAASVLPLLATLRGYDARTLRSDLFAGVTTAVMLVPQGMAYAMLAGLPPIYGLYASLAPVVVYALFGTCRQLSVGPVAIDSLLVAAGVGALAAAGSEQYLGLAILLALMVGVLQVAMGLGRLGFLVNFLSRPVIAGFMAAAALVIMAAQVPHLLGLPLAPTQEVHLVVYEIAQHLGAVNVPTLVLGVVSVVLLVALARLSPKVPRALAVVVLGTVAAAALELDDAGVAVVGAVPAGLPHPAWPSFEMSAVASLFPIALTIAFVGFIEAIAVGQRMGRGAGYEVEANRELVALGLANVAASLTRGFPVTGGLSRTLVNAQAGAKTSVAGFVTAGAVALTLVILTPSFRYLPKAVLAAIIVTAVAGLIDLREVRRLWRVKRADLAMMAVTFAATLALGIETGILVGVGTSVVVFVARTTRPHVAVLGRVPGSGGAYRNIKRFPGAETVPGVLAVRLDAQFYFGNVNFLKETLQRLEREMGEPLCAVVIDASGVNQIDSSAEAALREILSDYRARGVRLLMATVKGPVGDVLARSGFLDELGRENITLRVEDAMAKFAPQADLPVNPRSW
jgi:sulfate permease, SulP family